MTTFIIYIIRWAVTLTLLYSLYRLLLQRETFHRLNRLVLLAILVVSPLLPLIPLHTDAPTTFEEVLTRIERPLVNLSSYEDIAGGADLAQENMDSISTLWVRYCAYIYIIGIVIAFTTYIFRLLTLMRVIRRCHRISHPLVPKDVHLMLDMSLKQPSSWMRWILIGPIDLKQNAEPILKHELAHVRMGHSWDLILCDLTCHLLWCLPFAWMLRQDLVDVHEFQADEAVLQEGVTLEDYEHLLVRKAVQTQILPIMNTLSRGTVKKRFAMIYRCRSAYWSRLKLLYLIPAFAASLWVSARAEGYKTFLDDKLLTQEELEKINASTESVDTGGLIPEAKPKDAYFDIVEQMPQFPGGDAAMMQYISQRIRYPNIASENGVEGTINVEFIVETDGNITNVKALELSSSSVNSSIMVTAYRQESDNVSPLAKNEAIRALQKYVEEFIRSMPPFEPGRQSGSAVRTRVTLPITFKLN